MLRGFGTARERGDYTIHRAAVFVPAGCVCHPAVPCVAATVTVCSQFLGITTTHIFYLTSNYIFCLASDHIFHLVTAHVFRVTTGHISPSIFVFNSVSALGFNHPTTVTTCFIFLSVCNTIPAFLSAAYLYPATHILHSIDHFFHAAAHAAHSIN